MYSCLLEIKKKRKKKKKKRHRGHGDEARAFDLSTFGKCFEICIYLYRRIFNFGT